MHGYGSKWETISIEKKRGWRVFGRKTGMGYGSKIGRKEKKWGRRGVGRNTGMDVGQNKRIEKRGDGVDLGGKQEWI